MKIGLHALMHFLLERGASVGADIDIFNFQQLLRTQQSIQQKKHNGSPVKLKTHEEEFADESVF